MMLIAESGDANVYIPSNKNTSAELNHHAANSLQPNMFGITISGREA